MPAFPPPPPTLPGVGPRGASTLLNCVASCTFLHRPPPAKRRRTEKAKAKAKAKAILDVPPAPGDDPLEALEDDQQHLYHELFGSEDENESEGTGPPEPSPEAEGDDDGNESLFEDESEEVLQSCPTPDLRPESGDAQPEAPEPSPGPLPGPRPEGGDPPPQSPEPSPGPSQDLPPGSGDAEPEAPEPLPGQPPGPRPEGGDPPPQSPELPGPSPDLRPGSGDVDPEAPEPYPGPLPGPEGGGPPPQSPEAPPGPSPELPPPPPPPLSGAQRARTFNPASGAWGPFRFTVCVEKGGNIRMQATCKFHKEPTDAKTTRCTKSRTINSSNEDEVRRRLKAWLLAGEGITHRANDDEPEDSHKPIEPEDLPLLTHTELDAACPPADINLELWTTGREDSAMREQLHEAVAHVVQPDENQEKGMDSSDSDDSSSSSSSSASSSSSSDSD